jgi:hypothetical protein
MKRLRTLQLFLSIIFAAAAAFTVSAAESPTVKHDKEVEQGKSGKLLIQGAILYSDTKTPVVQGKWFYVVEATQNGVIFQRANKTLALAAGVTDEKGFLRIEVDRSQFKDREPFFNAERAYYTLISYPKNNKSVQEARVFSDRTRGIYLFGVRDKDFDKPEQHNLILVNVGTIFYVFPKVFDSLEKIPVLNADFDSLKFFKSGYGAPDKNQRIYETRFAQKEAQYINWELNLKYPAPGRRIDFDLQFICKRADTGEIVANQKDIRYIDSAWTSSYHNAGWGNKTPGFFWKPGAYTLSTYINGNPVAMDLFEVY